LFFFFIIILLTFISFKNGFGYQKMVISAGWQRLKVSILFIVIFYYYFTLFYLEMAPSFSLWNVNKRTIKGKFALFFFISYLQ